jgi:hypothetical protein
MWEHLRHGRLWLLLALIAASTVVLALPVTVLGASNSTFGTRYFATKKTKGSKVSIQVPPLSQNVASGEFVLHRAVVQSGFVTRPGLTQVGIYRSANHFQLDNCGVRSHWTKYTETKRAGTGNNLSHYHCHLFGEVDSGNEPTFSVYRRADAGVWKAEINGNSAGSTALGFGDGFAMIGGEINGTNANNASTTNARYGQNADWKTSDGTGLSNPYQVTSNAPLSTPHTGWTVGAVPTPLRAQHP